MIDVGKEVKNWEQDEFGWRVCPGGGWCSPRGSRLRVGQDVRLDPSGSKAVLRDRTIIFDHVEIHAGAMVGGRALILSRVLIEGGAEIGTGVTIEEGCQIGAGAIIGDKCIICAGVRVPAGTQIPPGKMVGERDLFIQAALREERLSASRARWWARE